jgi:replication-associated recombination protein RarA
VATDVSETAPMTSCYDLRAGGEKKLESLTKAAEALREAASEYRHKHGRPFVLVLDGVDRLATSSQETLLVLQV